MEFEQKKRVISKIFTCLCVGILMVLYFCPFIHVGKTHITTAGFVIQSIQKGTLNFTFYFLGAYLILLAAYIFYAVAVLRGRVYGKLHLVLLSVNAFLGMTLFMVTIETGPFIWHPMLFVSLATIEFVGQKFIEDIETKTVRAKVKAEEKERRQELRNRALYKIVLKNWFWNRKNYILFFLSAVMTMLLTFVSIGTAQILFSVHSEESGTMSGGLTGILLMGIGLIAIINFFLLGTAAKAYAKSRLKDYGLFLILGMRNRMLERIILIEYLASLVVAVLLGCVIGLPCTLVVRQVIIAYQGEALANINGLTFAISIGLSLLIFVCAFLDNQDEMLGMALSGTLTAEKEAEPYPEKRIIFFVWGIMATVIPVVTFPRRLYFENVYLLIAFCFGVYLLFYYGGSQVLKKIKSRGTFYHNKLLTINSFYYRYKANAKHIFSMFCLDFFVLFYLMIQVISAIVNKPEENYPYRLVAMFEQKDEDYFKEIEQSFDADIDIREMVRITVQDISEKREVPAAIMEIPQGQQIGLSETTYNELNGSSLSLKGKEIFISYQQTANENAHPVDFSRLSEVPGIHVGLPAPYTLAIKKDVFPTDYTLAGEERNLFIGHLKGGTQENVIVFSDEYFREIRKGADGPQYIALINAPESKCDALEKELNNYAEGKKTKADASDLAATFFGYNYDRFINNVYNTRVNMTDEKSETVLRIVVNILVIVALIFTTWVVQFIKQMSSGERYKRNGELLRCLGMRKSENKKLILRELHITRGLSFIPAIIITTVFTGTTLFIRDYSVNEVAMYLKMYGVVVLIYIIVQYVILIMLYKYMLKLYKIFK